MELQGHLDAIDQLTRHIENNRVHLFGPSEKMREIAAELNGLLSARTEAHWAAIRSELGVVGLGVAA